VKKTAYLKNPKPLASSTAVIGLHLQHKVAQIRVYDKLPTRH